MFTHDVYEKSSVLLRVLQFPLNETKHMWYVWETNTFVSLDQTHLNGWDYDIVSQNEDSTDDIVPPTDQGFYNWSHHLW